MRGWKGQDDIAPQGDGGLFESDLPLRTTTATNEQLRSQWETTFKRNTKRWTQDTSRRQRSVWRKGGEVRTEGINEKGNTNTNTTGVSESEYNGPETESSSESSDGEEAERVRWVSYSAVRHLTVEETIEKLSEEVGRCVQRSTQLHRRNLVSSAGDPEDLSAMDGIADTRNLQPQQQTVGPSLRPLRSPKEIYHGGRETGKGGSGRKAKTKAKGEDEVAVVLRGDVPAPDVYYFSKSNTKEGWLVKQGGRVQSWKKRYFILQPTKGADESSILYYFDRLPFKNANTPAKGALVMREVTSVDENDLPGKPLSFALSTFARKFWFQASNADEKAEWVQAFSEYVLENLSTSLEQVEVTSNRRTKDKLYLIHDDRPSVLKPLVDREEAIYFRLSHAQEEVPSFPAHLFCAASGVTLVEEKEYLCLEDSLHHLKRPCVCKLRLGVKLKGEGNQDAALGFKFKEIKVYQRTTDQYLKKKFPRKTGNKKEKKATKELLRFLCDGERILYPVVDVLLAKLAELIFWLEKDAKGEFVPFLLLKTTLLLAYDMDQPEAGETIQVKARVHRLHKLLDRIYYEKSLAAKVVKK